MREKIISLSEKNRKTKSDSLLKTAIEIQSLDAKSSGSLCFMPKGLVLATLPHREVSTPTFERKNGDITMRMYSDPTIGLPYGVIPRLVVIWLTTQAVQLKTSKIEVGESLNAFMKNLGLHHNGRDSKRFKNQINRLFSAIIKFLDSENPEADEKYLVSDKHNLGTSGKKIEDKNLMELWDTTEFKKKSYKTKPYIQLTESFYRLTQHKVVPLDFRAIKALSNSSLGLDIYAWIVMRLKYLKRPTLILWNHLQIQLGSDYAQNKMGRQSFKRALTVQMLKILTLYSEAKVESHKEGIKIYPSPSHIRSYFGEG